MNNPFGVLEFLHWSHEWNCYKYASEDEIRKAVIRMKEAGVGIVRMDFLWEDIEPVQGYFCFAKYDSIVRIIGEHGIEVLGILNYSTNWSGENGEWNSPPKENKFFVDYVKQVVERYKGKVKYWEIWNEPDSSVYWSKQDGLKSYCQLLKEAYIAAKQANPECKILNGGLAKGMASVNQLYDNGARDYFDILNIHFFETPLHLGGIKAVAAYPKLAYKKMCKFGDAGKKIWITEIGCPGVKRGLKVRNWWMGKNPTEAQQAKWVTEVYGELLKNNDVEKIFWAFFRDTNQHWDNGVDYFGMLRWDFSKKPSFTAYKKRALEWKEKGR